MVSEENYTIEEWKNSFPKNSHLVSIWTITGFWANVFTDSFSTTPPSCPWVVQFGSEPASLQFTQHLSSPKAHCYALASVELYLGKLITRLSGLEMSFNPSQPALNLTARSNCTLFAIFLTHGASPFVVHSTCRQVGDLSLARPLKHSLSPAMDWWMDLLSCATATWCPLKLWQGT